MRYRFIEAHKRRWPLRVMCRVMQVSFQGYYAWRVRAESLRAREERRLSVCIRAVFFELKGRYGALRVHRELLARGERCSRGRVSRLMRAEGLKARAARKFKVTTDSKHRFKVADNLLLQRFEASAPNQVWVADITYVWTLQGWLYVACVLDVFSRKVVGWAASHRIDRRLVLAALGQAVFRRRAARGLIHHSDRGSQYACDDYQKQLALHGMQCSMSRKGDCYDNAMMESFFHTLKVECVHGEVFYTREQAHQTLAEYIDVFYNTKRLHSALGYLSPVQFETVKGELKSVGP